MSCLTTVKKETTTKTECKNGKRIETTVEVITTTKEFENENDNNGANNNNNCSKKDGGVSAISSLMGKMAPQASKSTKGSDKFDKSKFKQEGLDKHNAYRKLHNVGSLKWDDRCAKHAQSYAEELARTNKFGHSNEAEFGENLYTSWSSAGSQISAAAAVESWYNEIKDFREYGAERPSNFQNVGHFTQVVWKGSTHVGMGAAVGSNGRVLVVANYLPRGNVIGQFHLNVLPPKK